MSEAAGVLCGVERGKGEKEVVIVRTGRKRTRRDSQTGADWDGRDSQRGSAGTQDYPQTRGKGKERWEVKTIVVGAVVLIVVATVMMMGQDMGSGAEVGKTLLKVLGFVAVLGIPALLISAGKSAVPHKRHYRDEEEDWDGERNKEEDGIWVFGTSTSGVDLSNRNVFLLAYSQSNRCYANDVLSLLGILDWQHRVYVDSRYNSANVPRCELRCGATSWAS
jgi:hypothetical protein